MNSIRSFFLIIQLMVAASAAAQTMSVEEYAPISTLKVPETMPTRAKFPFVDVHSHQWHMATEPQDSLLQAMDSLNMAALVHVSGRGLGMLTNPDKFDPGQELAELKGAIAAAKKYAPARLIVFTNINYIGIDEPGWTERTVRQLEDDVKLGAKGLKIYKDLGLTLKDKDGKRIATDDPRLDPVWAKCGELDIPVLIHTGEPAPFWMPKDRFNERWLELKQFPDRYRDPKIYPPWSQVMAEQHNVFRKHAETTFIDAHLGWMGNDLAALGKLLDELPNMYVEMGAVLAEIGRQPRFAREFFITYQDRILFGKDITADLSEYYVYFRVLETADEYFEYYRRRHAFWRMYGMALPDEVLKKVYYKNALRIIPGLDPSGFPR